MLAFLEMKEQEIMTSEQVESQLNLPEDFIGLQPNNFPLFVTVQRLIYMMDASLENSFFSRDSSNKIMGMENNLGWHREDRGVFMINQDFKVKESIQGQIRDFEL